MGQLVNHARCCPACGNTDHTFRWRKKTRADGKPPATVETRHRCKACGKDWKETVAVKAG